jgi:hypothetical protein
VPAVIIDDRTLLLGIDKHYRDAMKLFEATTMLPCASALAHRLGIAPKDVPIEGYYGESARLRDYLRLMRALQEVTEGACAEARGSPELERLRDMAQSPIFGRPEHVRNGETMMLAAGRDPLSQAMHDIDAADWGIASLLAGARDACLAHDDFSLVGLAARASDAIAMAATRESVVLYAEKLLLIGDDGDEDPPQYVWRVDAELARHCNRFIDAFNALVGEANRKVDRRELLSGEFEWHAARPIARAEPANAGSFHSLCADNEVLGRCVNLAHDRERDAYYHWAIGPAGGQLEVHDFWNAELHTTQRYRTDHGITPQHFLAYAAATG